MNNFIVKLADDRNELEDAVVVAFGKQKKESVIGSITAVDVGTLKVPSSNLTTFGANTSPLILIDNIELTATDLARLQPDDIESFRQKGV